MDESKKNSVFLSYAREDIDKVLEIYKGLKKRGLNVWLDSKDIKPGNWYTQIMKAISCCRYFVICISTFALKKIGDQPGFQDEELNRAYEIAMKQSDRDFTIIPVRIEDCERGDTRLSSFQQYDLFDNFEDGLERLSVHLGGTSLLSENLKDDVPKDKKVIMQLMGKGEAAYYAGEYKKVQSSLNSIIEIEPKSDKAWYLRGATLIDEARYPEALEAFNTCLEINPKMSEAYYQRGRVYQNIGESTRALSDYNNAIEIDPMHDKAINNRGNIYNDLGDPDKAESEYKRAIKINPRRFQAIYNLGLRHHRNKRYMDAISLYSKAIDINADYYEAYTNRGIVCALMGKHEAAVTDLKKAIKVNPKGVEAQHPLADSYFKLGQLDMALQTLEMIDDLPEANSLYGLIYINKGEYKMAIFYLNKAIEMNPDYAPAYVNRGLAFHLTGQIDKAIADLNYAIKIDPELYEAYYERACAFLHNEALDSAISDCLLALKLKPDHINSYYILSLIYKKLEKKTEEKETLEKVLELAQHSNSDLVNYVKNRIEALRNSAQIDATIKKPPDKETQIKQAKKEPHNNVSEFYGIEGAVENGQLCTKCEKGVFRFHSYKPGPFGTWTAWYRCNKCENLLPNRETFGD